MIAVGTTVVRALESAAGADGSVDGGEGWTRLVVTPERGVVAVDGLLTGWHDPDASHLLCSRRSPGLTWSRALTAPRRGAATSGTSSGTST